MQSLRLTKQLCLQAIALSYALKQVLAWRYFQNMEIRLKAWLNSLTSKCMSTKDSQKTQEILLPKNKRKLH